MSTSSSDRSAAQSNTSHAQRFSCESRNAESDDRTDRLEERDSGALAIRLGISLEPMDSTAERLANIRDAVKVGFDIVHVIGDRSGSAAIFSADLTTDVSERAGYTALEASYELLRLAGQQRSLVAIGPLLCSDRKQGERRRRPHDPNSTTWFHGSTSRSASCKPRLMTPLTYPWSDA